MANNIQFIDSTLAAFPFAAPSGSFAMLPAHFVDNGGGFTDSGGVVTATGGQGTQLASTKGVQCVGPGMQWAMECRSTYAGYDGMSAFYGLLQGRYGHTYGAANPHYTLELDPSGSIPVHYTGPDGSGVTMSVAPAPAKTSPSTYRVEGWEVPGDSSKVLIKLYLNTQLLHSVQVPTKPFFRLGFFFYYPNATVMDCLIGGQSVIDTPSFNF